MSLGAGANPRLTGVIDERRQFRVLYRNFLFRVIDLELLSVSGETRNLLVQFAALLAAYSFVLAVFTVPPFALSTADHSKLVVGAWGVEEFLISTTLTVAGLFAVLAWNAVLPDRRDGFVLDPLPLRSQNHIRGQGLRYRDGTRHQYHCGQRFYRL